MYPPSWGPHVWRVVHLFAYMYKLKPGNDESAQQREDAYAGFFENLCTMLPCPGCEMHCKEKFKTLPPPVRGTQGTNELFEWSVNFHNMVNKATGKAEYPLDRAEQDFKDQYLKVSNLKTRKEQNDQVVEAHERIQKLQKILKENGLSESPEDDDDDEPRTGDDPNRRSISTGLLIGVVCALVVALVVLFILIRTLRSN